MPATFPTAGHRIQTSKALVRPVSSVSVKPVWSLGRKFGVAKTLLFTPPTHQTTVPQSSDFTEEARGIQQELPRVIGNNFLVTSIEGGANPKRALYLIREEGPREVRTPLIARTLLLEGPARFSRTSFHHPPPLPPRTEEPLPSHAQMNPIAA